METKEIIFPALVITTSGFVLLAFSNVQFLPLHKKESLPLFYSLFQMKLHLTYLK